jgi:hypothetical protein
MMICTDHCAVFATRLKKKQAGTKDLVINGIGEELVSFYGSPALSMLHAEYADQYVFITIYQ